MRVAPVAGMRAPGMRPAGMPVVVVAAVVAEAMVVAVDMHSRPGQAEVTWLTEAAWSGARAQKKEAEAR